MNKHTDPNDPNVQVIENASLSDIRPGDYVIWLEARKDRGVVGSRRREGIAYYRDEWGDWRTKEGAWVAGVEEDDITITIRRTLSAKEASK